MPVSVSGLRIFISFFIAEYSSSVLFPALALSNHYHHFIFRLYLMAEQKQLAITKLVPTLEPLEPCLESGILLLLPLKPLGQIIYQQTEIIKFNWLTAPWFAMLPCLVLIVTWFFWAGTTSRAILSESKQNLRSKENWGLQVLISWSPKSSDTSESLMLFEHRVQTLFPAPLNKR